MKLVRDLQNKRVVIYDNDKKVLELSFFADEFTYTFYSDELIIISKDLDSIFYESLNEIMDNKYYFPHEYSYQEEDLIVWLSDVCCDLEDKSKSETISRLIMRRKDDKIYLSAINPFCEKNNIKREYKVVSFSPAGNGFLTKNLKTRLTFQDEIISAFQKVLFKERVANRSL